MVVARESAGRLGADSCQPSCSHQALHVLSLLSQGSVHRLNVADEEDFNPDVSIIRALGILSGTCLSKNPVGASDDRTIGNIYVSENDKYVAGEFVNL